MFDIDKDKDMKVHFVGIGGISMSGLAQILIDYGFKVSGSDRSVSDMTEKLKSMGADIYIGHDAKNVHGKDLVVYTSAVKDTNPEIAEAKKLNIPLMGRAEFLGSIMKKFKYGVAISGTHGKTTTTSMVSLILLKAELDPTIMVGGELDAIGGNVKPGKSDYFVTEACEYKRNFLKFFPYIGVILNIDADHLDYYKDIDDIESAFAKFADLIPKDGTLIGFSGDKRIMEIMQSVKCNKLTYGISSGDFTARNIKYDNLGCASFTAYHNDKKFGDFTLNVPGEHNVLNALAAIACAYTLNVNENAISSALSEYGGTHRRFEKKGTINGITVIDDYAHHPAEIHATLKAALNYPHKRLFVAFQPHTYSRTKALFDRFSKAFTGVDKLVLADIYAAREKDTGVVSSKMLCDAICKNGVDASYFDSFEKIVDYLKDNLKPGDVLITMGAGDIYKVGDEFLSSTK